MEKKKQKPRICNSKLFKQILNIRAIKLDTKLKAVNNHKKEKQAHFYHLVIKQDPKKYYFDPITAFDLKKIMH